MVVLKVCLLLLFLVGVTAAPMELSFFKSDQSSSYDDDEYSKPCCDLCMCTRSMPPQCSCEDIRLNSCHSDCKSCMCTRSQPGQCRCLDTNDFCYKPCKSRDD
uniref:Bowman-Birk proteinase isoinhibitor D-II n=1 Tax=Glycine max TaxID=3847 RepID=Q43709_SOYBN|nr:Bowman-Birk proteinase isoinhibitor D-II [Glycine max]CAA48658.1 Soybean Bowman-Birk proteinase isoinhibitor D-II [Glycine max]prf//2013215A Bowman-Birk protease inhibitor [Glycine max]